MTYTVKQGDTLSTIARDVLGNINLWPEIARINNIANANLIYPGQVLQLPTVTKTVTQSPSATTAQPAPAAAGIGVFGWFLLLSATAIGGKKLYDYFKKKKK